MKTFDPQCLGEARLANADSDFFTLDVFFKSRVVFVLLFFNYFFFFAYYINPFERNLERLQRAM